jgi:hypothetical protein
MLVVDDIEAARAELLEHGVTVSEVFHDAGTEARFPGPDPERRSYSWFVSFSDRPATAGSSRSSPPAFPAAEPVQS